MANLLSKVEIGGVVYSVKDAESRTKLVTLLGGEEAYEELNKALGTAAWETYQTSWDASTTEKQAEIPSVGAVKTYVDAQVQSIPKFDVVIDPSGTAAGPSVPASASTMYKIYFVPDEAASAGTYVEWITLREGTEGSYTYKWEKLVQQKQTLQDL